MNHEFLVGSGRGSTKLTALSLSMGRADRNIEDGSAIHPYRFNRETAA